MDVKLYPSVMCMEIRSFESAGVDGFHVDVMDGSFVKDCSPDGYVASVRACTSLPLDVHLMVRRPADYLEEVYASQPETIYVHAEAEDVPACLEDIRGHSYRVGLAVRPETQPDKIAPLLPSVSQLLVLRVQPGKAGQPSIPSIEEKIDDLLHLPSRGYGITLDGCVSKETVVKWHTGGVQHYVCGIASGLFSVRCEFSDERRKQVCALRWI